MFKAFDDVNLKEKFTCIINHKNKDASEQEESDLNLRLIGQEKSGVLLLSWKQLATETQCTSKLDGTSISAVGLYDLQSQKCKIVYHHETNSDIINATVNEQQTFIGFVTRTQQEATGQQGRRCFKDVYRAYLAEINPQNRVFYLNLEREGYIMLQFLYGQYKCYNLASELHLLVVLHNDSVGLYHLPQVYDETKGWILGAEPKKEQIFFKTVKWAEWDFTGQRLYILYQTKATQSGGTVKKNLFSCYQFTENLIPQNTLELSLDLPIPELDDCDGCSNHSSVYYEACGNRVIPDITLNMRVVSKENGIMCICYQHYNHICSGMIKSPDGSGVNMSNANNSDIGSSNGSSCVHLKEEIQMTSEYSVILVHKKKTVYCKRQQISSFVTYQISFFYYASYIVVHVPGCWTHLLSIDSDNYSLHNIFWTDPSWSPCQTENLPHTYDGVCTLITSGTENKHGCLLYQNHCLHMVKLNPSTLCQMFHVQPLARVGLIHLAVLHVREFTLIKQLFDIICRGGSHNTVELFEEFLVGSVYSYFSHIAPKWICRLIPCTASACVSRDDAAHIESNLHKVTYTHGLKVEKQLLIPRNWEACYKYWILLFNNWKTPSTSASAQFLPRSFQLAVYEKHNEQVKNSNHQSPKQQKSSSFLNKIKSIFGSSLPSSKRECDYNSHSYHKQTACTTSSSLDRQGTRMTIESFFGKEPEFIGAKDEQATSNMILEFMVQHIQKHQTAVSKEEAWRLAEEYIQIQMYYSNLLAHIICNAVQPAGRYDGSVFSVATPQDVMLFKMLERFYLATEKLLYPTAVGFSGYFLSLGYRCLPMKMFLQYVDNGVLKLTKSFVLLIIRNLEDDDHGIKVKFQLLSRLQQLDALQCLRDWGHPEALQHISYHYATKTLSTVQGCSTNLDLDTEIIRDAALFAFR